MSSFIETVVSCMPVEEKAVAIFGKNTPAGRQVGSTALLQLLRSPQNLIGMRIENLIMSSAQGKKNAVKIMTTKPYCFTVCPTDFSCNPTFSPITPAVNYFEWQIETLYTPCVDGVQNSALKFAVQDWEEYCKIEDGMFLAEQITQFDDRFAKEFDKIVMQSLFNSVNAGNIKTIPVVLSNALTAQTVINSDLYLNLFNITQEAGYSLEDYFIIGGTKVNQIASKLGIVTYSIQGGAVGNNTTNLPPMYYDSNFDAVFGSNAFLMIPKGAFQLVTYQAYSGGLNRWDLEKEKYGTKAIPLANSSVLPVDYQWKLDTGCTVIQYMPSVYMELVSAIPGTCTDPTQNGVFLIKDCNTNPLPIC